MSFRECPPLGAVLYGLEIPPSGGDTLFSNLSLAYETLSDGMKEVLERVRGAFAKRHVHMPSATEWTNLVGHLDQLDELGMPLDAVHEGIGPEHTKFAVASIEHTDEFRNSSAEDLDTERFGARLVEAVEGLAHEHDDIGVLLLECASCTKG